MVSLIVTLRNERYLHGVREGGREGGREGRARQRTGLAVDGDDGVGRGLEPLARGAAEGALRHMVRESGAIIWLVLGALRRSTPR